MGERHLPWLAALGAFALGSAVTSIIEDWKYLADGGAALLGGSGLAVYADHPGIQVGPLGLLLGGLLHYAWAGRLATAALLVPALRLATRDASRRFVVAASVVMSLSWTWLVVAGHLEDAVAAVAILAAIKTQNRWHATGWLVVAAAAKPWAACALPLLLGWGFVPILVGGLGVAAVYLPFLAQPGALASLHVTFLAEPSSLYGLLLNSDPDHLYAPPNAYRLVQLGLVAAAVALVVWRRQPWAVLAVLVGSRIILDVGTWHYYYPPMVAGLLLVDLQRSHRLPWLATAVALLAFTSNTDSHVAGVVRLAVLVAVLAGAVVRGDARRRQSRAVDGYLVQRAVEVDAAA